MKKKILVIGIAAVVVIAVLVFTVILLNDKEPVSKGDSDNKATITYERNDEKASDAPIEVKTDSGKGYSELIPLQPIN